MNDRNRSFAWVVALATFIIGCDSPVVPIDACLNLPGFQETGPCVELVHTLSITIESPRQNFVVAKGETLGCQARVEEEHAPEGSTTTLTWFVNDSHFACEALSAVTGPELVSGSPAQPASFFLAEGSITLRVEARNSVDNLTASDIHQGVVEPEPGWILYALYNNGEYDFYKMYDNGRSDPVRMTNSGGTKAWIDMSPDSQQIVYHRQGATCPSNLAVANPDGTEERLLTTMIDGYCPIRGVDNPRYSPDGRLITFVGAYEYEPGHSSGSYGTFVINRDGSGLRQLAPEQKSGVPNSDWLDNETVVMAYGILENGSVVRRVYVKYNLTTNLQDTLLVVEKGDEDFGSMIRGVTLDREWTITLAVYASDFHVTLIKNDGSREVRRLPKTGIEGPFSCQGGHSICYVTNRGFRVMNMDGTNDRELRSISGGIVIAPHLWRK